MHVIQSTFQRWTQELPEMPESVLSKFHFCFYFVFPLLSLLCFVLTVTTHRTDAGLVVIAILSALYESVMCWCCMKKQMKLGYVLWLHAGVAMMFSGSIALEYSLVVTGGSLLCFGILIVLVVSICVYIGHDVFMERTDLDIHSCTTPVPYGCEPLQANIDLDMTFPPPPERYWV